MSALGHFKWLAAGIAAIAAVFCVGCGGNDNPTGGGRGRDGDESRLSVNGAQVYRYDGSESNYTGSFTNVSFYEESLADLFTNPVVNMTNGKLTINLGMATELVLVEDFEDLGGADGFTVSDPAARIFGTEGFGGDCVFGRDCGVWLGLSDSNPGNENYEVALCVADRPVTYSYNREWCDWDEERDACNYKTAKISISLQKGWNAFSFQRGSNGEPIVRSYNDLSGSGILKWVIYDSNDDDDNYYDYSQSKTKAMFKKDRPAVSPFQAFRR
jgi:hypothetical protein